MLYTQYYIEGIKNVSKFLDKFQESVPHTKTRKKILSCVIPCVCWKTNYELISVRKHKYDCMLDDGIY